MERKRKHSAGGFLPWLKIILKAAALAALWLLKKLLFNRHGNNPKGE